MNMQMKTNIKTKGFSLIEVMIALVILAVGILGISILQGTVIKNSTNANQRSVAVSLAQKKIDDLKSFVKLTSSDTWTAGASTSNLTAASLAYSHIDDNKGGAPTGNFDLLAGNITVGNYDYTMNWDVTDYMHTAALTVPSVSTPPSGNSDMKLVTVTVAWVDELGEAQDISLSTVIDAYAPALTAFSDNPTATGGEGPKVQYTPLSAPDVVPVTLDIGEKKKESSKPIPDVSKKGDSTVVEFQAITFTPNASAITSTAVRQEEFLTAVCNCKGGASTNSIIKGFFEWDPEDLILKDVASAVPVTPITKTAVDNSGGEAQHVACNACCRDAADTASTFKTCRMKRIDGIYRIYEPWKMIAYNIIPSSFFNTGTGASGATASNSLPGMTSSVQASNIALYSEYVKEVVRDALTAIQSTSTVPATIDTTFDVYVKGASSVANFVNTVGASTIDHKAFTVSGDPRAYQVRALYIDIPPGDIYEGGDFTPTGVSAVPLDRVPFFENNFTQVAGWIPDINVGRDGANTGDQSFDSDYTEHHDDMDNNSCQQTDNPSGGRNYVTNEEFFHQGGGTTTDCPDASRGLFHPIASAPAASPQGVSTVMFTSNDGIVDKLVDPAASSVAKSIDLTVE